MPEGAALSFVFATLNHAPLFVMAAWAFAIGAVTGCVCTTVHSPLVEGENFSTTATPVGDMFVQVSMPSGWNEVIEGCCAEAWTVRQKAAIPRTLLILIGTSQLGQCRPRDFMPAYWRLSKLGSHMIVVTSPCLRFSPELKGELTAQCAKCSKERTERAGDGRGFSTRTGHPIRIAGEIYHLSST